MNFFRIENQETRVKAVSIVFKRTILSCFFFLVSFFSFAQDSIPEAKDLSEEKELNFQQYFFKALSHKSIGNYQKAIENLEECNQILTNDVTVFFEFSKNYLLLNNTLLAKEYINRALTKEPKNSWMLKHLVKIYIKDRNFSDAILIQQKVVDINLKERGFLVRLYLQNNNYKKAIALMNKMEEDNALSSNFKRIKTSLEKRKEKVVVEEKTETIISLKDQFKTNKSYAILKQIIEESKENSNEVLKYCNEGISLFPAQPFVYLMKGKALNYQKKHNKALLSLQNGIDFVIEDKMEADFYKEMSVSYKGLGNIKQEKKFLEKAKKIKN